MRRPCRFCFCFQYRIFPPGCQTGSTASSSVMMVMLSTMLMEEKKSMRVLFPRKKLVPTVFSLHPEHSLLIGALAQIDYSAVNNVRVGERRDG